MQMAVALMTHSKLWSWICGAPRTRPTRTQVDKGGRAVRAQPCTEVFGLMRGAALAAETKQADRANVGRDVISSTLGPNPIIKMF